MSAGGGQREAIIILWALENSEKPQKVKIKASDLQCTHSEI